MDNDCVIYPTSFLLKTDVKMDEKGRNAPMFISLKNREKWHQTIQSGFCRPEIQAIYRAVTPAQIP
jgi:hypothetical protein